MTGFSAKLTVTPTAPSSNSNHNFMRYIYMQQKFNRCPQWFAFPVAVPLDAGRLIALFASGRRSKTEESLWSFPSFRANDGQRSASTLRWDS